ncbi:ATP-dependent DNA helicase [Kineococcus sp. NUM-3379]
MPDRATTPPSPRSAPGTPPAPGTGGDARTAELLDLAVRAVGGQPREGQQRMAGAVTEALRTGRHLLVQAGTGTGKSLAYLVPAVAHAVASDKAVVVSTATLALQAQLDARDMPRVAAALAPALHREITWQLLKGRANYLCRNKLDGGFGPDDEPADVLFGAGEAAPSAAADAGRTGREVVRLREWALTTATGDRDEIDPGVGDRAWRQVSVTARECLGQRCPAVAECFSERARARARQVDVVLTNHALTAIDAVEGRGTLPEHDLLVLDEAHELADRVTAVGSKELSGATVHAATRRVRRAGHVPAALEEAADDLADALGVVPPGRVTSWPQVLTAAVGAVRDTARTLLSELKEQADAAGPDEAAEARGGRQLARAAVSDVFAVAERLAEHAEHDVVWASDSPVRGPALHVAPLSVAGLLRERVFADRTVVCTSATLTVGGSFDAVAGQFGLRRSDGRASTPWSGLDVGSPFDYARQGILYVARHLPPPGRDGAGEQALAELSDLVAAAGGRTLGLFSSRRAAEQAAQEVRRRTGLTVLCQGEDRLPRLVRRFAAEEAVSLFGTLSLWQGVDVPGPSCQLVVIDRIPFPRPDDPLMSARAEAVSAAGGNGFMSVSAAHAGVRLAQGAGRLVRSSGDRGVVAVLDARLATARYGEFLRRSLPEFWPTTSGEVARRALERLAEEAGGASRPVAAGSGRS